MGSPSFTHTATLPLSESAWNTSVFLQILEISFEAPPLMSLFWSPTIYLVYLKPQIFSFYLSLVPAFLAWVWVDRDLLLGDSLRAFLCTNTHSYHAVRTVPVSYTSPCVSSPRWDNTILMVYGYQEAAALCLLWNSSGQSFHLPSRRSPFLPLYFPQLIRITQQFSELDLLVAVQLKESNDI